MTGKFRVLGGKAVEKRLHPRNGYVRVALNVRIEEMRSGIEHLRKKVHETDQENNALPEPAVRETDRTPALACDLDVGEWSVVSFDEIEAGGLTYSQAVNLVAELEASNIPGLCIITDNAARKALVR